jgi:Tfp pilus assembly protein FimV
MMMSSRTDTLSGKDVTSGSQSNAVAARQTKESDPEELQAKVQKLAKAARTLQHNLALRTGQVGDLKK